MKKLTIVLFVIVTIIIAIICLSYSSYKMQYNQVIKENAQIEEYTKNEIYGTELGTLINKVIDKNTKNQIEKDNNGVFISNEENSIKIEIYMEDNEQLYEMETFYNAGMEKFIQYYGNIQFKCSKIEYHKKTGKIKYLLFEQHVTS